MTIPYHIIIPARLASTRLPQKVLLDIAGKPMLQHVYEIAAKSQARSILIATDSKEIQEQAKSWGAACQMTDPKHPHGASRISEVLQNNSHYQDDDIIVALQADEPLLPLSWLDQLALFLNQHPHALIATLAAPFRTLEEALDPNKVKVVLNQQQEALYFSRSLIPWQSHPSKGEQSLELTEKLAKSLAHTHWHIGLYAYRAHLLKNLNQYAPSPLEELEQLEQLRWLWHGINIKVACVQEAPMPGVNTPEELALVRAYFRNKLTKVTGNVVSGLS